MTVPNAYLSHQIPKRLRLYIPLKKNVPRYFTKIKDKLSEEQTIDGIKVNPKTGSLLIFHQCSIDELANYAKQRELFIIRRKSRSPTEIQSSPSRNLALRFSQLDFQLNQKTQGELDLTTLAVGGLMGLALLQMLKGKILPPAWTLFSQAINEIRLQKYPL